jgi:hypothetical protein
MTTYSPNNIYVFQAAYAGALAGMAASNRVPTDDLPTDPVNTGSAQIAGAFAQSFDQLWGSATPTQLDVEEIESVCSQAWWGRTPQNTAANLAPSTYNTLADALIAIVDAGDNYFASIGVIPEPIVPTPSGYGVPLTVVGGELVAHINALTGVDAPSSDGSAARPFQTWRYFYQRIGYLSQSPSKPDLSVGLLTSAVTRLHVFGDAPPAVPTSDPVGIVNEVYCPEDGQLLVDLSPSQTIVATTAMTALTQATNYALSPAHYQVLTLAVPAAGFQGLLFVDTTQPSSGWIYRSGVAGGGNPQIPGANNVQVSPLLATTNPLSPNVTWPLNPTLITPGGTDACQIIRLGVYSWGSGGSGFSVRGRLNAGTATSAQLIVYRGGFVDGGQVVSSGYGAQLSLVECSFEAVDGNVSLGQAASAYNCSFNPVVIQRSLDSSLIGGWVRNVGRVNEASNVTIDGVVFDACELLLGAAGGAAPTLGQIGFYTTNVNTPGIDLSSGEAGCGGGAYGGQIGYAASNLTYPFRSNPNTLLAFSFAAVFGALAGTPTTIGFYPWPLAIFTTYQAIHDPYSGAFGGLSQGVLTYPVSQKAGVNAAGTGALGATLAAEPGTATQFYVGPGSHLWDLQVDASTYVTAGAGGATLSMQVWVDGAAILNEPALAGISLGANGSTQLSRTVRLNDAANGLTTGLHSFALALAATAGSASTPANGTRVATTVVPQF